MPGILEITAMEYYSNEIEDDIENGKTCTLAGLKIPLNVVK